MSATIIAFPEQQPPNPGNGAPTAIKTVLESIGFDFAMYDLRLWKMDDLSAEDRFLARLWMLGFKVVPLDGTEDEAG